MPSDLSPVDDKLTRVLTDERERQRGTLSLIASLLDSPEDDAVCENTRELVQELCREFPLYEESTQTVEA